MPTNVAICPPASSPARVEQLAELFSSPLRRPRLHVHFGPPVRLTGTLAEATAQAHSAVTTAWHTAADRTRR